MLFQKELKWDMRRRITGRGNAGRPDFHSDSFGMNATEMNGWLHHRRWYGNVAGAIQTLWCDLCRRQYRRTNGWLVQKKLLADDLGLKCVSLG